MIFSIDTLISMATLVAIASGVLFMMRYLGRGETQSGSSQIERLKREVDEKLSVLAEDVIKVRTWMVGSQPTLSEEDRDSLLKRIAEQLKDQAAQDVLARLQQRVGEQAAEIALVNVVVKQSEATIDRLRQELFSLSKRGNLNLSIGIVTTLTGLLLLGMFVLQETQRPPDLTAFIVEFAPRLSLVLLIEIFAYFFLRLYKTTLFEIKYFQNEVTSMEARFLALVVATSSNNADALAKSLDSLAHIERNFILSKDQTTLDLERVKLEHQEHTDIVSKLAELIRRKRDA